MRTIKFRARKATGEWAYFTLNDLICHRVPAWVYENPAIEKQQFTGLKDKNGKEIYEGDIVKCEMTAGNRKKPEIFTEEVKFIQGAFICRYYLGQHLPHETEVIGNIYDNPELLTN